MRIRPGSGVDVAIEEDGCLVLACSDVAVRYLGSTADTARWIALQESDGDSGAAADRLADAWGTDAADTRADLELWIGRLCHWGLLRHEA